MSAAMTELEEKRIVQQCNIVLAAAGLVATVRTLRDVSAVCSSTSIFVATFEALGGDRLEGVVRRPATVEERAANCDLVVAELSKRVNMDMSHIDGARVVQGEMQDVMDLLEIFTALTQHTLTLAHDAAPEKRPSASGRSTSLSALYAARGEHTGGGCSLASSPTLERPASASKPKARVPSAAAMRKAAAELATSVQRQQAQQLAAAAAGRASRKSKNAARAHSAPPPWRFAPAHDAPWAAPIATPPPPRRTYPAAEVRVPKRRPASAGSPRWNKPHSAAGVGDAAALEEAAVEEALRNLRRELETEDDQLQRRAARSKRRGAAPKAKRVVEGGVDLTKGDVTTTALMSKQAAAATARRMRAPDEARLKRIQTKYSKILTQARAGANPFAVKLKPQAHVLRQAQEAAVSSARSVASSLAAEAAAAKAAAVCARATSPVVALNPRMTTSLENLVKIRDTTKSNSAAKLCSISRQAVEAEKRVVGLKAAWVKTRVTERKQDKAQDAELNRQRSRALPHTHKVAGLRKAAFEKQLRQQHHARTVSRQNQEAALFRQLFVEAVEREKEVLLLDQRLAREVLADLEKSEMLREQRDERVYRDGASLAAAAVRAERDMRKHARKEAAVIRQLAAREEEASLGCERRRLLLAVHAREEAEYGGRRVRRGGIHDSLQSDVEHLVATALA